MAQPAVDFATEEFGMLLDSSLRNLNHYMKNSGPLIGYTSTGHGAWEATVTNLFDVGESILLCDSGQAHPGGHGAQHPRPLVGRARASWVLGTC